MCLYISSHTRNREYNRARNARKGRIRLVTEELSIIVLSFKLKFSVWARLR